MRSSRRRMRPSRSAHGDTSSSSTPNARMASESTTAPATIWNVRSAVMPGSAGRASAGILREARGPVVELPPGEHVAFRGSDALLDGAGEPRERADRLRGADDVVGRRQVAERADRVREHAAGVSRAGVPPGRSEGGSSGRNATVERPAPRGSERATSGTSSMPCAISSEPPPMSKSRIRSADQPYQRRTARKVRRASSSPESTCSSTPVSRATRASTSSPFAASRMADVAKGRSSSMPASRAASAALADRGEDGGDALVADRAVGLEVAHEPQHRLVRRLGDRAGARMGVDDEQVHGVGTDVEDPEAHAASVAAAACTRRAFRAYWSDWDDRPTSVGDGVERSRVTRIPASERRTALIEAALRVVSPATASPRRRPARSSPRPACRSRASTTRSTPATSSSTSSSPRSSAREQQAVIPDLVAGQSLRELLESGLLGYFEHLKRRPRARAGDARAHPVRAAIARAASARRSPSTRGTPNSPSTRSSSRREHAGRRVAVAGRRGGPRARRLHRRTHLHLARRSRRRPPPGRSRMRPPTPSREWPTPDDEPRPRPARVRATRERPTGRRARRAGRAGSRPDGSARSRPCGSASGWPSSRPCSSCCPRRSTRELHPENWVDSVVAFGMISGIAGRRHGDRLPADRRALRPHHVAVRASTPVDRRSARSSSRSRSSCSACRPRSGRSASAWVAASIGFCIMTAALTATISDQVPVEPARLRVGLDVGAAGGRHHPRARCSSPSSSPTRRSATPCSR